MEIIIDTLSKIPFFNPFIIKLKIYLRKFKFTSNNLPCQKLSNYLLNEINYGNEKVGKLFVIRSLFCIYELLSIG